MLCLSETARREVMMRPQIKISKAWLENFCIEHHITKMSLFGSVISDHFTLTSDVDVLVEFDPRHIPSLFSFVEMRDLLSEHFGREVDLKTPEDISKLFRNEVIEQSYLIYGKERFKST
jgi:predicted nucleotidyltransferase